MCTAANSSLVDSKLLPLDVTPALPSGVARQGAKC